MGRGHLEGAHRSQHAVVLYREDNVRQAVELGQVLGRNLDLLLFRDVARVHILGLLGSVAVFSLALGPFVGSGLPLTAFFTLLLDSDELLLRVALEVVRCCIDEGLVLVVEVRQLCELELALRESPVEFLHWELVHTRVGVCHSNVVVSVQACNKLAIERVFTSDLAPEEKLLGLGCSLQLHKSHLDLHSKA